MEQDLPFTITGDNFAPKDIQHLIYFCKYIWRTPGEMAWVLAMWPCMHPDFPAKQAKIRSDHSIQRGIKDMIDHVITWRRKIHVRYAPDIEGVGEASYCLFLMHNITPPCAGRRSVGQSGCVSLVPFSTTRGSEQFYSHNRLHVLIKHDLDHNILKYFYQIVSTIASKARGVHRILFRRGGTF